MALISLMRECCFRMNWLGCLVGRGYHGLLEVISISSAFQVRDQAIPVLPLPYWTFNLFLNRVLWISFL
jgi:hypothetical protein